MSQEAQRPSWPKSLWGGGNKNIQESDAYVTKVKHKVLIYLTLFVKLYRIKTDLSSSDGPRCSDFCDERKALMLL